MKWLAGAFTAGVLLVAVVGLRAADGRQDKGFDLRTGQWEFALGGLVGVLPDLTQLPPDARAKAEAELRKPRTVPGCIKPDDIRDLNLGATGASDDDHCKTVSKKVTRTTADQTVECTGESKRTEVVHFDAVSRESLRITIQSSAADGTSTMAITGKWVSDQCKEE